MMRSSKFTVVSLFSGAGGFDWGFHRTGQFETRIACELLEQAAATLAYNLGLKMIKPDQLADGIASGQPFVIQGDIAQVDFSKINFQPDVLIGGPPCQDFSITISKKNEPRPGLNGGRGKLYIEFVRAVMFLQPKVFVFENVPGLMSANEGAALRTILNDLQHLEQKRCEALRDGYPLHVPAHPICDYKLIFHDVVHAPDVGVPQTRRRLIIIGLRQDVYNQLNSEHLLERLHRFGADVSGKGSLLARFPLTCIEALEGLPLTHLQERYRHVMLEYAELAERPHAARWRTSVWDRLKLDDIRHDYFLANGIEDTPTNREDYEAAVREHEKILEDLKWLGVPAASIMPEDGSNKMPRLTEEVIDRMYMIPPDENYAFVDHTEWSVPGHDISFIYRRAAPLKPAWTVMAYGGGGTYGYHYERNRAQLTLRERARIQTFTDDFLFQSSRVRAQIGEAVPPLLAQRIANSILELFAEIKLTPQSKY
jgi:DNA (cytosine-5)-methyltransferase 1